MLKVPEKIFIDNPKGFEKFKADVIAKFEKIISHILLNFHVLQFAL